MKIVNQIVPSLVLGLCIVGCSRKFVSNDNETDERSPADSGGDTGADSSSATERKSDSSLDTDVDAANYDICDDLVFPPSNGPDGCRRVLLSQIGGVPMMAQSDVAISRDGSIAAFTTYSCNELMYMDPCKGLPEDTNEQADVYSVDLNTYEMEVISVSSEGTVGNGDSYGASFSADGRFVVFGSYAGNLDPRDDNSYRDVYLRDRESGTTEVVSLSESGEPGDEGSYYGAISANGGFVIFASRAENLVAGDTNGAPDLFVRDLTTGALERVTMKDDGTEPEERQRLVANGSSPYFGISDDGRYVVFVHESALSSDDTDNTDDNDDLYLFDRETGKHLLVSRAPDGYSDHRDVGFYGMSPDGTRIIFATSGDEHYINQSAYPYQSGLLVAELGSDGFVFDQLAMSWRVGPDWVQAMSDDWRYVAFHSDSTGYVTNVQILNSLNSRSIGTGYLLDRENNDSVTLVTASEDGTPGIVPDYRDGETDMNDYVTIAMSGDSQRIVFSTIQYGIVDTEVYDIPCTEHLRFVYLRDCTAEIFP